MLSSLIKRFKPAVAGTESQSVRFLDIYYRQDRSLLPYLCFSCLATVIFLCTLVLYKAFFCKDREDKLSQFIDIELVSQADFKDTKNLLPASLPKPSLAKRSSPVIKSKGQIFTDPVFIIRAPSSQNKQKEISEEQKEQQEQQEQLNSSSPKLVDMADLAKRYVPMNTPISRNYKPLSVKTIAVKKSAKLDVSMNMEEVKPPEMVEVTENDGDDSTNRWQDGGSSNNGAGISSSLAEYLKDLHRKLKQAWVPPLGTVHHIKVIFRLNRMGSVVSTQLIQSSGDKVADDSALLAIQKASPFGKLPSDYPHQFLDLAYKFNYTADELKEINQTKEDE